MAILETWNRTLNLTAALTPEMLWERHVLDSLQLHAFFPQNVTEFVDLGSGAGFPGIIVAIAGDRHVHLVESDRRKAAFLREATRVAQVRATIHACRAETLNLAPMKVLTARALAPLDTLLSLALPLLERGGMCLFPKGRTVDAELTVAAKRWHMTVSRIPSLTHQSGCILRVHNLEPKGAGN